MASGGAVALESPVRRDLATMPSTEFSAEGLRKADSLQPRSSISLRAASSGDAGPPRHKRARRDAVRRVWDWLDMSMNREASMGLSSTTEAVAFGQMHLSEGSPATTVITTNLDVSPGDAVEPCVSSLPDGQAPVRDTVCVSSKPTATAAPALEASAQLSDSQASLQHDSAAQSLKHIQVERERHREEEDYRPGLESLLELHMASKGSAPEPGSQPEGGAADRSLLGPAYQRQGSSRKRKHGSPAAESPHAAEASAPADTQEMYQLQHDTPL